MIESLSSTGEFAFDYSRNEVEKRKSLESENLQFGKYFWECMADGEPWSFSYDGILLILMDLFSICREHGLQSKIEIYEMLQLIQANLKNMMYALIMFKDKFQELELESLMFSVEKCYQYA